MRGIVSIPKARLNTFKSHFNSSAKGLSSRIHNVIKNVTEQKEGHLVWAYYLHQQLLQLVLEGYHKQIYR